MAVGVEGLEVLDAIAKKYEVTEKYATAKNYNNYFWSQQFFPFSIDMRLTDKQAIVPPKDFSRLEVVAIPVLENGYLINDESNEQRADLVQIENDDEWGSGSDGCGKNTLGKILMEIRHEIYQEDLQNWAATLISDPSSTELNLSGLFIDDEGLSFVIERLNSSSVVSVDLSNNNFGVEGCKKLREMLFTNRNIIAIDLSSHRQLSDEVLADITAIEGILRRRATKRANG